MTKQVKKTKSTKAPSKVKHIMIAGKPVVTFADLMQETDIDAQNAMIEVFLEQLETRGNDVVDDIHNFACFAIDNAIKNSNSFALMTALIVRVQNMKAGIRAVRLREWFEENAPVKWENTKIGKRFVFDKARDNTAYRLDYAINNPFYKEAEKGKSEPYSLVNLKKAIETAIKRASSDKANPQEQVILKALAQVLETQVTPKITKALEVSRTAEATGEPELLDELDIGQAA